MLFRSVSSEGKAVEVVSLKKADVSRADFDGEEAVVVKGLRVPVSDGVEVYNKKPGAGRPSRPPNPTERS